MLGPVSELNPDVCLVLQTRLSVPCSHLARGHAGRRERLQKALHLNAVPACMVAVAAAGVAHVSQSECLGG